MPIALSPLPEINSLNGWLRHLVRCCLLLVLAASTGGLQAQISPNQTDYQVDFAFFWETIRANYAYFDQKQIDWNCVRQHYQPQVDTLRRRTDFIRLLERALGELYDNHAALDTNLSDSYRMSPSGADLYAEWVGGRARVLNVRPGFGAARVGIKPGMVVEAINGVPVAQAVRLLLPTCLSHDDQAAHNFNLNQVLAGNHRTPRRLTLTTAQGPVTVEPDQPVNQLENYALLRATSSGSLRKYRLFKSK